MPGQVTPPAERRGIESQWMGDGAQVRSMMDEGRRRRELLNVVKNAPGPSSPAARAIMQRNKRRDSVAEMALRSELHRRGLRFRVDFPIRSDPGRPIRPDIVFTRARLAIFVDGCFWHGCEQHGRTPKSNAGYWEAKIELNQERDRRQLRAFAKPAGTSSGFGSTRTPRTPARASSTQSKAPNSSQPSRPRTRPP
jgi:DNA mismatch endonuclease, patch repair protein